jgi:hypothetical protein
MLQLKSIQQLYAINLGNLKPATNFDLNLETSPKRELGGIHARSVRIFQHLQMQLWIPANEGAAPFIIQDLRSDLKQQMRSLPCPTHLLLFNKAFADNLIDRCLHKETSPKRGLRK